MAPFVNTEMQTEAYQRTGSKTWRLNIKCLLSRSSQHDLSISFDMNSLDNKYIQIHNAVQNLFSKTKYIIFNIHAITFQ